MTVEGEEVDPKDHAPLRSGRRQVQEKKGQESPLVVTPVIDKGYLALDASGVDNSAVASAFIRAAYTQHDFSIMGKIEDPAWGFMLVIQPTCSPRLSIKTTRRRSNNWRQNSWT
ncbi:hypothetical protein C1H46_023428 [Malus baccata]|uniref:Uncharacterized protein n=1 Tax=Malus baccata TaxID=106549 RepID=A0A540LWV8_MALBA|nr:hypothetical protein C1H46_023428 [Malus baccata]